MKSEDLLSWIRACRTSIAQEPLKEASIGYIWSMLRQMGQIKSVLMFGNIGMTIDDRQGLAWCLRSCSLVLMLFHGRRVQASLCTRSRTRMGRWMPPTNGKIIVAAGKPRTRAVPDPCTPIFVISARRRHPMSRSFWCSRLADESRWNIRRIRLSWSPLGVVEQSSGVCFLQSRRHVELQGSNEESWEGILQTIGGPKWMKITKNVVPMRWKFVASCLGNDKQSLNLARKLWRTTLPPSAVRDRRSIVLHRWSTINNAWRPPLRGKGGPWARPRVFDQLPHDTALYQWWQQVVLTTGPCDWSWKKTTNAVRIRYMYIHTCIYMYRYLHIDLHW